MSADDSGSAPSEAGSGLLKICTVVFLILAFGLQAFFQFRYSINADNAVMLEFARRLMAGGALGIDVYELNPPLCILIYSPVVLLSQLTGLAADNSLTIYTLSLTLLSVFLCWHLLRRLPYVGPGTAAQLAAVYLFAGFYASGISFGERDHLILLGLMPLLLAQFAMNEKIAVPRAVLYSALLFGAIAILVKPHYMLMPALMVLWRIGKERRPGALVRADVAIMGGAALLYAVLCLTIFSGYARMILPDAVQLYSMQHAAGLRFPVLSATAIAVFCVAAAMFGDDGRRRLLLMMGTAAACLLLAYITQGKGYYYHFIPALTLLTLSFAGLGLFLIPTTNGRLLLLNAVIAVLMLRFPVHPAFPTREDYRSLPLAQLLQQDCTAPCSFFISNQYAFMSYETALYEHAFFASRFDNLWFEPPLTCGYAALEAHPDPARKASLDARTEKYGLMLAQDFERYKPSLVALYQGPEECGTGQPVPFDFARFFARSPAFVSAWNAYRYQKTITFNRRLYFTGTSADYDFPMRFDIYRRMDKK